MIKKHNNSCIILKKGYILELLDLSRDLTTKVEIKIKKDEEPIKLEIFLDRSTIIDDKMISDYKSFVKMNKDIEMLKEHLSEDHEEILTLKKSISEKVLSFYKEFKMTPINIEEFLNSRDYHMKVFKKLAKDSTEKTVISEKLKSKSDGQISLFVENLIKEAQNSFNDTKKKSIA